MISISADNIALYPALQQAGLFHRRSTDGDEKQLVDAFLADNLTPPPAGQTRFVFVEPRLETGFPDVVLVYLDTEAAKDWTCQRAALGKLEICVLHHIATSGGEQLDRLQFLFPDGLARALKKLQAAGLLRYTRERWRTATPRKLLAVRRIVAIEAKVGAWRPGLDQAFRNRWFASESYLLLPAAPNSPDLNIELRACGVGLLTTDTPLNRPLVRATKGKLPGSYASWLFNEWACNARTAPPKA